MEGYSIGSVCDLLGIKPHVLRYWERELAFLNPQKDDGGRRVYRESDLQLLYRIRYLVYERKMGLDGVERSIWEELSSQPDDLVFSLRNLRGTLLKLSFLGRDQRKRLERVTSPPDSSDK